MFSLFLSTFPVHSEDNLMASDGFLVDDFTGDRSAIGTRWESISDRVMGGVSNVNARLVESDTGSALYLSGNVSLENNGGFIQVRLPLKLKGRPFDAREYEGITLRVRGSGDAYYVHLRTTRTVLPWMLFSQGFPVSNEWQWVRLPFSEFKGESIATSRLDTRKLVSLGIVAAKEVFKADLYVDSILLYR